MIDIQTINFIDEINKSDGSFSALSAESVLESLNCDSLKSKLLSKKDFSAIVFKQIVNQKSEQGLSLKSQLVSETIFLNACKTTNFIYQIENYKPTPNEIESINSMSKIKDRIEAIYSEGGLLSYLTLEQAIFKDNLLLLDSFLPNILAEIIKAFFTSNLNSIKNLTDDINIKNPIKYDTQFAHTFYEYKIKRFLTDIALGMTPAKVWTGIYDATGGYLIVKKNGDVLCYHIYNRNQFEDYLFANTKLETPSSTKHDFGRVIEYNGKFCFKLNLQIRFT